MPEFLQKVARDLIEMRLLAVNEKRDVLVETIVEGGVDDVISGREAQARVRFQQGKVLQMRIAVSDKHKQDEAAEKTRKVNLRAG